MPLCEPNNNKNYLTWARIGGQMFFCPHCGNMLLLGGSDAPMYCQTCKFKFSLPNQFTSRKFSSPIPRKQVDDVLGGDDAWKNVDSTEATCPKCEHNRAYFMQIQIRSADEPSSIFYKCCKCTYQWREG
jgi:DNA-directed RNA polymerase III subunit RPC11